MARALNAENNLDGHIGAGIPSVGNHRIVNCYQGTLARRDAD